MCSLFPSHLRNPLISIFCMGFCNERLYLMQFKLFHPPNQPNPQPYQVELPPRIQNKSSNSGPKPTYHRNLMYYTLKIPKIEGAACRDGVAAIEVTGHSSCNPRNTSRSKLHHERLQHVTQPEGAFAKCCISKLSIHQFVCHPSCPCI
jgi:hypothetical protein